MICKICGKEFRRLGPHIKRSHGLDGITYFDKYLKKDKDGSCLFCNKQTTFININEGYRKYCSPLCVSRDPLNETKKRLSLLSHFGTENLNDIESIIKKRKETNIKKYGVDNPFKSDYIKKQIKETNIKKYGCSSPYLNKDVQTKGRLTSLKKFGVDHWAKTDKAKLKSRNVYIKMIEDQKLNGEPLTPRIGSDERLCLDFIENQLGFKIQRNQRMFGFFPDGYVAELNLVIEFDEDFHNNSFHTERDFEKDSIYEQNNIRCFRIKKKNWLENKENVLINLKNMIGVINER